MRHLISIIGLVSLLLLGGCGYKEGVATGDRAAYLYFSGNTENVTVSVDGGAAFEVEAGRDNQYKIQPGKHTVHVYRSGRLIVEREIYVGDGVAKEIGVQ
ncbi:MAG: hypothetical protein P8Y51_06545 [Campylobacterales bacterium]